MSAICVNLSSLEAGCDILTLSWILLQRHKGSAVLSKYNELPLDCHCDRPVSHCHAADSQLFNLSFTWHVSAKRKLKSDCIYFAISEKKHNTESYNKTCFNYPRLRSFTAVASSLLTEKKAFILKGRNVVFFL